MDWCTTKTIEIKNGEPNVQAVEVDSWIVGDSDAIRVRNYFSRNGILHQVNSTSIIREMELYW